MAEPTLHPGAVVPGARRRQGVFHRHILDAGTLVSRDIPFPTVNGRTQYLDLYRPSGPPPAGGWPVIVAIHGGGWYKFGKSEYGSRIASGFVRRGFAVVAPNYLLSRPGRPTWPINLEDVQSAVRWTRARADALGLNPNRIFAMGESAGGNLAELLGTGSEATPEMGVSDRVTAVVAFSGPSDLVTLFQQSPAAGSRAVRFLGGPPGAVPAAYRAASPVDQVRPGAAPMLLIHGSADPLVPVAQSQEMSDALAAAGVPHRFIRIPGGTHDLNFPIRYANLFPQILAFLDES
jgi:acetyl esterase/lipase